MKPLFWALLALWTMFVLYYILSMLALIRLVEFYAK